MHRHFIMPDDRAATMHDAVASIPSIIVIDQLVAIVHIRNLIMTCVSQHPAKVMPMMTGSLTDAVDPPIPRM